MQIYIWKRVANVTTNYHDEGGVVVTARSLKGARKQISKECPKGCGALTKLPDYTYTVREDTPELLLVFPDAGCC